MLLAEVLFIPFYVGVWFYIIKVISQIAVLTNGLLISFTSQFIPYVVYQHAEARYDKV